MRAVNREQRAAKSVIIPHPMTGPLAVSLDRCARGIQPNRDGTGHKTSHLL